MTGHPLVSILVVTYNNQAEIGTCLEGVLAQENSGHELEVVVVDNASSDETTGIIDGFGDKVTLVRQDHNTGYAAGVNAAFAASAGDIVVLLNPDCVMDDGCVAALCQHLTGAPGVGVAAARLRYPDDRPQLFARRELTIADVVWGLTHAGRRFDERFRSGRGLGARQYRDAFANLDEPLTVDCPAAACVAIWRHLLARQPGGVPMSSAFPILFNDADLYRRLRSTGYRCEVVPGATARHGQGTTLRRVPKDRMRAEFVASLRRYAAGQFGAVRSGALWLVLAGDAGTSAVLSVVGTRSRRRTARLHAKGTMGGLGLPKGSEPWLTTAPRPRARRALKHLLRERARLGLRAISRRSRRRFFLARLALSAWIMGARVDATIHPTADIGRGIVLEIKRRARVQLVIGERARIQSRVLLRLQGGELSLGPYGEVRVDAALNIKGALDLAGRNIIGKGAMVHADTRQVWEWGASIGEYASVIDSEHRVDGSPVHVWDQPVTAAPVRLGAACFVAGHAVVTAGTTIGRGAVVAAHAVVTRDVADGETVAGVPARPLPRRT